MYKTYNVDKLEYKIESNVAFSLCKFIYVKKQYLLYWTHEGKSNSSLFATFISLHVSFTFVILFG